MKNYLEGDIIPSPKNGKLLLQANFTKIGMYD